MSVLAIEGLEAGYEPGRPVLTGVDLEVPAGSTVAVLGPNGGGKTTLFRALLGELPHLEGGLSLPARIGYVPQTERTRLDFPVSALDVVLMGTYASVPWYRRLGSSQKETTTEALERVGLGAEAGTHFGRLSGGQRQRVLIARALARRAELLLLDEPLSGVDRPSGASILALFDELKGEGVTTLVSTHDIEQARSFDLVLCVNGSQIAFGPPAATLSPEVLQRTYGSELIVLGGERAVVVQHHDHGDGHEHDSIADHPPG